MNVAEFVQQLKGSEDPIDMAAIDLIEKMGRGNFKELVRDMERRVHWENMLVDNPEQDIDRINKASEAALVEAYKGDRDAARDDIYKSGFITGAVFEHGYIIMTQLQ